MKTLPHFEFFIFLSLTSFIMATPAAGGNAMKSEIKDLFDSLETVIQTKDTTHIMEFYDQSDTDFFERTSRKYQNWLALEDFKYSHRINSVNINDKTAVAVVFQKVTYKQYNRSFTDVWWRKFKNNGQFQWFFV